MMSEDNDPSDSRPPPLVNRLLSHPSGANMWHKLYDDVICDHVPALYAEGRFDCEVAAAIGIAKSTFYDWIKQYPRFADAVRYGKTLSESHMTAVGRGAAEGKRKIDGHTWHILMRNGYGYDKEKNEEKKNDQQEDNEKMKGMIEENAREY